MKDKLTLQRFVQLIRVKHWTKNFFIFSPLLLSGRLFEENLFVLTCITFLSFCFVASGLYVFNDILDAQKDQLHPQKSRRLLCTNRIRPLSLFLVIFSLLGAGLGFSYMAGNKVLLIALAYIGLHIAYNFIIKKIVILDVVFIAVGFLFRVWAGAVAIGVQSSVWLDLCIFVLALFLGFTKRRYEISTLKDKAVEHRRVLSHYTSYLLDQIIIICSTLVVILYGLYAFSSPYSDSLGEEKVMLSIGFVIYGIFRYLYLIHVHKLGSDPAEVLFKDMPLFITVVLWILYLGALIYVR